MTDDQLLHRIQEIIWDRVTWGNDDAARDSGADCSWEYAQEHERKFGDRVAVTVILSDFREAACLTALLGESPKGNGGCGCFDGCACRGYFAARAAIDAARGAANE